MHASKVNMHAPTLLSQCTQLRKRDVPEEKYSNAFVGYGDEKHNFVLEVRVATHTAHPSLITP